MQKILLILSLGVAGSQWSCAFRTPSLGAASRDAPSGPVIIIPGILGTQLVDTKTGNVVWGKVVDLNAMGPHEALLRPDLDGLELPVDTWPIQNNRDGLVPAAVLNRFEMINRILEVKIYQNLIDTFRHWGFQVGNVKQCTPQDNLYLFPYDWRRDLVETAILLGDFIEQIKRACHNPELKVTIVAHSMGGLIAKYYLMYGQRDVIGGSWGVSEIPDPDYSGARNVEKVFFLGTPHHGSAHAFRVLNNGEYLMPLVSASRWVTFTMPSLYEMLPLDTKSMFVDAHGNPVDLDIFDIQTWTRYGIGIFNSTEWQSFVKRCSVIFPKSWETLAPEKWEEFSAFIEAALDRGRRFQRALAAVDWTKVKTEYYIIAGDCYPTLNAVRFSPGAPGEAEFGTVKGKSFGRAIYEKYYFTGKGDKTVLFRDQSSELHDASDVLTGCFAHRSMPSNPEVQEMILENLGVRN